MELVAVRTGDLEWSGTRNDAGIVEGYKRGGLDWNGIELAVTGVLVLVGPHHRP